MLVRRTRPGLLGVLGVALTLVLNGSFAGATAAQPRIEPPTGMVGSPAARIVETVSGMPPVLNPANLYSETRSDKLSPVVAPALPRVYVPNLKSNTVFVIDPATFKVIDRFRV